MNFATKYLQKCVGSIQIVRKSLKKFQFDFFEGWITSKCTLGIAYTFEIKNLQAFELQVTEICIQILFFRVFSDFYSLIIHDFNYLYESFFAIHNF